MTRRSAIDIAIDARGRKDATSLLSVGPLPEGVKSLLRIVAEGEWRDATTEHAYRRHSAEDIRAASAAFLAAVLFERQADPYRVLGLAPGARPEDVRENKRLLLKWLHPDRNPSPREQDYLGRVIEAAEAIEEGRALPPQRAVPQTKQQGRPTGTARPPRSKPHRRLGAERNRQVASRAVEGFAHVAKLTLATAFVAVSALTTWRYVMNEPIGASLARYSKLAFGMITW